MQDLYPPKVNFTAKDKLTTTEAYRLFGIYIGPVALGIGPILVSMGSSKLQGKSRDGLIATGAIFSSLSFASTLLKKGAILHLGRDAERDVEVLLSRGEYLFWLLVLRSQSVGIKYFRHEWEHLNSFGEFVSTNGKDRTEYREKMADEITKNFKCDNLAILLWTIASLSVHIGLVLTNPKGRAESKTYVVDAGVPALINFIVVTYYVTRLMQQILTNFITADILAEWGVKDKRDSVDEAETRAYKAVREVCQSPELNEANDSKHRKVLLWDQKRRDSQGVQQRLGEKHPAADGCSTD